MTVADMYVWLRRAAWLLLVANTLGAAWKHGQREEGAATFLGFLALVCVGTLAYTERRRRAWWRDQPYQ